jgi:hypothetical protein
MSYNQSSLHAKSHDVVIAAREIACLAIHPYIHARFIALRNHFEMTITLLTYNHLCISQNSAIWAI